LFKNIACDGGAFLKKTFSENPVDKYLKRFAFMLKVFNLFLKRFSFLDTFLCSMVTCFYF